MAKKRVLGLKVTAPSSIIQNGRRYITEPVIGWALVEEFVDEDSDIGGVTNISEEEIFNIARNKVGVYLKSMRDKKGLSIDDISLRTGLSKENILCIEEGSVIYSFDTFLNMVRALDCMFYLEEK